ncbi:MAG: peptidoglycan-binding protein [Acidobacteriota bacterium]|nr:peptidoglycan-binding protein [Acidobacteriota bacterium]
MRFGQLVLFSSIALGLTIPAFAATRTHRHSASRKIAKHAAKPKFQSPRGIEDQRATEIQAALIKAGYLSGGPSGHWDSDSEAAMRKLQGDNGWQTKLVPDSRALIKLGLGPGSTSPEPLARSGSIASNSNAQGQQ